MFTRRRRWRSIQGGQGGEAYSLNHLLREAEDWLVNAVNPFSKLRDVLDKYAVISMFLSIQYAIIMQYVVCGVYEVRSI